LTLINKNPISVLIIADCLRRSRYLWKLRIAKKKIIIKNFKPASDIL